MTSTCVLKLTPTVVLNQQKDSFKTSLTFFKPFLTSFKPVFAKDCWNPAMAVLHPMATNIT